MVCTFPPKMPALTGLKILFWLGNLQRCRAEWRWIAARHRSAIWMRFARRAAGRITRSKDKGAGRGCRGTRATRATPAWTFKRG